MCPGRGTPSPQVPSGRQGPASSVPRWSVMADTSDTMSTSPCSGMDATRPNERGDVRSSRYPPSSWRSPWLGTSTPMVARPRRAFVDATVSMVSLATVNPWPYTTTGAPVGPAGTAGSTSMNRSHVGDGARSAAGDPIGVAEVGERHLALHDRRPLVDEERRQDGEVAHRMILRPSRPGHGVERRRGVGPGPDGEPGRGDHGGPAVALDPLQIGLHGGEVPARPLHPRGPHQLTDDGDQAALHPGDIGVSVLPAHGRPRRQDGVRRPLADGVDR